MTATTPGVASVLQRGRRVAPHREALVDRHRRLTYAELHELVERVAHGLLARQVGPGDRVAVSLPNGVDVVVAFLAAARVGALFVGLHPGLAPPERQRLVDHADPHLLIATPTITASGAFDALAIDVGDGGIAVVDGPPRPLPRPEPDWPVAIAYTSGTTGRPKGVVHDQFGALLPAEVILTDRMRGRGERVGVQLPLTTLNVQVVGSLLALLGVGTCVCIDTHEPAELAAWIQRERIEHLACSPATAHDLVESPDVHRTQLAGLRLGVGGASCPEQLRTDYRERFGRDFTTGYGLSEAPAAVAQETERIPHRPGASGRPMAHVDVSILDDERRAVPPGEAGEIAVGAATGGAWQNRWRGMQAYWRRPDDTAAARAGGRLLTGDEGVLDDDGYLYVADRRIDVINRGGSKVSPAEVEAALRTHPDVADCIVVGQRDRRLGHRVAAVVESRSGRQPTGHELRRHCASLLAGYKVPEQVVVRDRLPRNAMGKVVRADVERLLTSERAERR